MSPSSRMMSGFLGITLVLCAVPAATFDHCGSVVCMNSGGVRSCKQVVVFFGNGPPTTNTVMAGAATACSTLRAGVNPNTVTFVAKAPVGSTGTCTFQYSQLFVGSGLTLCQITAADGLPVELLDFNVVANEAPLDGTAGNPPPAASSSQDTTR